MLQNITLSFTRNKNLELKIHQQTQNLILKNTNRLWKIYRWRTHKL
jgi:hypothetical protein